MHSNARGYPEVSQLTTSALHTIEQRRLALRNAARYAAGSRIVAKHLEELDAETAADFKEIAAMTDEEVYTAHVEMIRLALGLIGYV